MAAAKVGLLAMCARMDARPDRLLSAAAWPEIVCGLAADAPTEFPAQPLNRPLPRSCRLSLHPAAICLIWIQDFAQELSKLAAAPVNTAQRTINSGVF